MRKYLACVTVFLCTCSGVYAQHRAQLDCQGVIEDVSATLVGIRQYTPFDSLGDGYVEFEGDISAGGITGQILYEGYTATAPFDGVIRTSQGTFSISVLDNTDGQFIIYSGTPTLGPPQTLGNFVCQWQ
jgi:hypothetical protein